VRRLWEATRYAGPVPAIVGASCDRVTIGHNGMLMRALRPKGRASEKRKTVRMNDPGAAHLDKMLDEALRETFPASDPVAITIETPSKAVAVDG
jgi:hypothetical protein